MLLRQQSPDFSCNYLRSQEDLEVWYYFHQMRKSNWRNEGWTFRWRFRIAEKKSSHDQVYWECQTQIPSEVLNEFHWHFSAKFNFSWINKHIRLQCILSLQADMRRENKSNDKVFRWTELKDFSLVTTFDEQEKMKCTQLNFPESLWLGTFESSNECSSILINFFIFYKSCQSETLQSI